MTSKDIQDLQEEGIPEHRSIRECFDPVPYETDQESADERMPGDKMDMLNTYFRAMGAVQQLTPQQETELWQKIDGCLSDLRHHIYRYGFVCEEHLKLLADTENEVFSEMFLVSSGKKNKLTHNPSRRREWNVRIAAALEQLKVSFSGKKGLEESRDRVTGVLMEYPVRQDKLLEWEDVARRYLENFRSGTITSADLEKRLLMTPDEFERNVKESETILNELNQWKNRMVETNLRLVITIAKHYQNRGLPLSDLIQEGNIGLMKALERFDYNLGHHFATYATWWIRQGVSRAISAQARVIRLPIHMLTTIRKMQAAERAFIQENGREPEDEDTASILEMPVERVRAVKKMSAQCLSLQATGSSEDGALPLEELLGNQETDNPMIVLARKTLLQHLAEALDQLSERERQLISLRYGLDGGGGKSLSEVAAEFKITRERVRQIEIRALEKMRRHSGGGEDLNDYFL